MIAKVLVLPAPQAECSVPVQTTVGTAAIVLLAARAKRKGLVVQNTGVTVLKLTFGSTDPTQTTYHIALAPGASADDGTGATYFDDAFTGAVRAISSVPGGTALVSEFMTGSADWVQAAT